MKYVLTIVGIGLVVAFVLHGVDRKQVNGEALREMERIGLELNNIADHLEKTRDVTAVVNMLRNQVEEIDKYASNPLNTGQPFIQEPLDWEPQMERARQAH